MIRLIKTKISVIALSIDVTAERDFAHIMPMEMLGVYVTRVAFENPKMCHASLAAFAR